MVKVVVGAVDVAAGGDAGVGGRRFWIGGRLGVEQVLLPKSVANPDEDQQAQRCGQSMPADLMVDPLGGAGQELAGGRPGGVRGAHGRSWRLGGRRRAWPGRRWRTGVGQDDVGGLLTDHEHRRHQEIPGDGGEDGGVDDPQAGHPADPEWLSRTAVGSVSVPMAQVPQAW